MVCSQPHRLKSAKTSGFFLHLVWFLGENYIMLLVASGIIKWSGVSKLLCIVISCLYLLKCIRWPLYFASVLAILLREIVGHASTWCPSLILCLMLFNSYCFRATYQIQVRTPQETQDPVRYGRKIRNCCWNFIFLFGIWWNKQWANKACW